MDSISLVESQTSHSPMRYDELHHEEDEPSIYSTDLAVRLGVGDESTEQRENSSRYDDHDQSNNSVDKDHEEAHNLHYEKGMEQEKAREYQQWNRQRADESKVREMRSSKRKKQFKRAQQPRKGDGTKLYWPWQERKHHSKDNNRKSKSKHHTDGDDGYSQDDIDAVTEFAIMADIGGDVGCVDDEFVLDPSLLSDSNEEGVTVQSDDEGVGLDSLGATTKRRDRIGVYEDGFDSLDEESIRSMIREVKEMQSKPEKHDGRKDSRSPHNTSSHSDNIKGSSFVNDGSPATIGDKSLSRLVDMHALAMPKVSQTSSTSHKHFLQSEIKKIKAGTKKKRKHGQLRKKARSASPRTNAGGTSLPLIPASVPVSMLVDETDPEIAPEITAYERSLSRLSLDSSPFEGGRAESITNRSPGTPGTRRSHGVGDSTARSNASGFVLSTPKSTGRSKDPLWVREKKAKKRLPALRTRFEKYVDDGVNLNELLEKTKTLNSKAKWTANMEDTFSYMNPHIQAKASEGKKKAGMYRMVMEATPSTLDEPEELKEWSKPVRLRKKFQHSTLPSERLMTPEEREEGELKVAEAILHAFETRSGTLLKARDRYQRKARKKEFMFRGKNENEESSEDEEDMREETKAKLRLQRQREQERKEEKERKLREKEEYERKLAERRPLRLFPSLKEDYDSGTSGDEDLLIPS